MSITNCDYRDRIAYNDTKANKVVLSEAEHARTTLWCLKPGQHIHAHVHAGDHVWVILEGEGLFLSEGQAGLPRALVFAAAGLPFAFLCGTAIDTRPRPTPLPSERP